MNDNHSQRVTAIVHRSPFEPGKRLYFFSVDGVKVVGSTEDSPDAGLPDLWNRSPTDARTRAILHRLGIDPETGILVEWLRFRP